MRQLIRVTAVLGAYFSYSPQRADAQNMDVMAKWSAVTVVRYAVVGEYAGEPDILLGTQGYRWKGRVTDRVELTFDWDQNETALVGTPTFKNFPARMAPPSTVDARCSPVRVNGHYERVTIVSVKQTSSVLEIATTRSSPPGVIPYMGENSCEEDTAAAKTESDAIMLVVVPTVFFGMGSNLGTGLSISPDGKSIVFVDAPNGWTWTYTPTPVR